MRILSFLKRSIISIIEWIVIRIKSFCYLLCNKELYQSSTYFPEFAGKSRTIIQCFFDQCRTIFKWGYPNEYYYSYGLDVKKRKEHEEYIQFRPFIKKILYLNLGHTLNCCCILRDKILFNIFANGIGVDTPEIIWFSSDGHLYDYKLKKEIYLLSKK